MDTLWTIDQGFRYDDVAMACVLYTAIFADLQKSVKRPEITHDQDFPNVVCGAQ